LPIFHDLSKLNTMTIKAVFFDLDGTLLDSAPDFVHTLNQLCDEYNVAPVSASKVYETVSNGARALTTLAFGLNHEEPGFEERRLRLLDIYFEQMGKHCRLYEGMTRLLQQLKQHKLYWGIITNKPARFTQPLLKALEFPTRPDVVLCPDHVTRAKPAPEALELACQQTGCKPAEVIYIGDHKRDIDCGISAGSTTIAAGFGYIEQDDDIALWKADHVVWHVDEIWPIIRLRLSVK
jgi:2-phosphoglycolate phosphatase